MKFLILESSSSDSILNALFGLGEATLYYFGRSLSREVQETFYDVVFVDINLCKRKGTPDPIKIIKDHSPHTKIILTTYLKDLKEISESFWHPCDRYLSKPFSTQEVAILLRGLLPHKL